MSWDNKLNGETMQSNGSFVSSELTNIKIKGVDLNEMV